MEEINNLESNVLERLDRSGDFKSVLHQENLSILTYKDTTALILEKNSSGSYDASFSQHSPKIREYLK